jgi:hypothetical protein
MSSLLLFGLPLLLFATTLAFFLTQRRETIQRRDKAYWKALNIPWSLVTICSFLLLTSGAYQAEQRQRFDLATWKVNTSKEMALGFVDSSEAKWCVDASPERRAVSHLGHAAKLDDFCVALREIQQQAKMPRGADYGASIALLEKVSHPMIPRHEILSVLLGTKKLAASEERLEELGTHWDVFRISMWPTLFIACVFAVAAAVRVATVYAEWQIQLLEDASNLRTFTSSNVMTIAPGDQ